MHGYGASTVTMHDGKSATGLVAERGELVAVAVAGVLKRLGGCHLYSADAWVAASFCGSVGDARRFAPDTEGFEGSCQTNLA